MAVEDTDVLKVLDSVIRYLMITLPGQSLSPDAQMGREDLLQKVQDLIERMNAKKDEAPLVAAPPRPAKPKMEAFKDDTKQTDEEDINRRRLSSYVDMTQTQFIPTQVDIDISEHNSDHGGEEEGTDMYLAPDGAQDEPSEVLEEDYEVPGTENKNNFTEVSEVLEEKEYEDIVWNTGNSKDEENRDSDNEGDDISELTDDELLAQLKGLENTCPKQILLGSVCSGNLLKQKKKGLFSKWNKRYCILRDHFLFYYRSEQESKALGVVVLPGYNITPEKTKFIFKITPTGKGRSTYLFQLQTKEEFDRWYNFLLPICSQKLNRLKSDVFNRVAKQLDGDSDEGSAGEPVKAPTTVVEEEQDMYELVPEDGLASTIHKTAPQPVADFGEDVYDDVMRDEDKPSSPKIVPIVQQSAQGEDLYEGIPGESYVPEPAAEIIEEDLYEAIPALTIPSKPRPNEPSRPPLNGGAGIPPRSAPPSLPTSPIPSLPPGLPPPRTPVLPPRGAPSSARPGTGEAPPPPPPSIPSRKPASDEPTELIEEEDPDEPAEDDFSYDNVYIGTQDRLASESDELGFKRGDIIYILQKVDPNWWIGCLQNKVGLVPSSLLTEGFAH